MLPQLAELEQVLADTPIAELPAFIGILATLQAKAQFILTRPDTKKDAPERLLTMAEAAKRLSIPDTRAYELARQGKLPAVRIGKYVRVLEGALAEYQARLPKA